MSTLRATAILSASSLITILVGIGTTKGWAVLLGPVGLGYMGLLQGLIGFAGLIAGAGIGTGLVRMGSHVLAKNDNAQLAALHRAAWLLTCCFGGGVVAIMVVLRGPISIWMLGGREHAWTAALMSIALVFNIVAGVQTSLLNAHHRVKALAQSGVASSVIGAIASLGLVWKWREDGIVPAIIINSLVLLIVTTWMRRRHVAAAHAKPSRYDTIEAARSLLQFGVPYSASMLVGTGVQFAIPAVVLYMLGPESVGHYRAAVAISVTYLGFMLTAMALDYYPRVSAVSDQPEVIVRLVNEQLRLTLLLIVPLIFGMLAMAPFLIPRLYSSAFSPSVNVLEWQLAGDLLRFWSWTMGTALLARGRSRTIFCVELVFGVNILVVSYFGMHWFGLVGSGLGFLGAYGVHFLLVWAIVRRDIPLVWTTENRRWMLATLIALATVLGLTAIGLEMPARVIAMSIALLTGAWSLNFVWKEHARSRMVSREGVSMGVGEA